MAWSEIKYALNSGLGTSDFRPVDEIISKKPYYQKFDNFNLNVTPITTSTSLCGAILKQGNFVTDGNKMYVASDDTLYIYDFDTMTRTTTNVTGITSKVGEQQMFKYGDFIYFIYIEKPTDTNLYTLFLGRIDLINNTTTYNLTKLNVAPSTNSSRMFNTCFTIANDVIYSVASDNNGSTYMSFMSKSLLDYSLIKNNPYVFSDTYNYVAHGMFLVNGKIIVMCSFTSGTSNQSAQFVVIDINTGSRLNTYSITGILREYISGSPVIRGETIAFTMCLSSAGNTTYDMCHIIYYNLRTFTYVKSSGTIASTNPLNTRCFTNVIIDGYMYCTNTSDLLSKLPIVYPNHSGYYLLKNDAIYCGKGSKMFDENSLSEVTLDGYYKAIKNGVVQVAYKEFIRIC